MKINGSNLFLNYIVIVKPAEQYTNYKKTPRMFWGLGADYARNCQTDQRP